MSLTYGAMKARIANELHRTNLSTNSHIANAIKAAIKHYERERWYFNEATTSASLTTTTSLATYTLPSDFMKMDNVMITQNGWKNKSTPMPYIEMDSRDAGNAATKGVPSKWAIYGNLLRHYPVPDAAYVVTISYQKRLAELSEDEDTNEWVDDFEELTRTRAEWWLCTYVMRNREQAAVLNDALLEIYAKMRAENDERLMSGRLTSHSL